MEGKYRMANKVCESSWPTAQPQTALSYDIPVIEAAQAAVMLLELSAKMGLKQSRITYMRPPQR